MRILPWLLQVLVLSAGIHLFLRFVRTTRGSRLIRGLYVAVLLGWVGLWGLSKPLGLEELQHILESATGFLVVIFAIVFQPELRRGIAQLGERSFGGALRGRAGPDTVGAVVRAAKSMATRRHGALIAFEKESSLATYVETGAHLDSEVSARLIETLFNPKGPLHDGAIVVRRNRVVAAGCFFPLPQEGEFDPSMGTRHRAALGLTEDTDAVVVVVSEETGTISIAQGGQIRSNITPDKLEDVLRDTLASSGAGAAGAQRPILPKTSSAWKADVVWMLASVLLACGMLYVAHQDIRTSRPFTVRINGVSPAITATPDDGTILVVLPEENHQLVAPDSDETIKIVVHGSLSQLAALGGGLSGIWEINDPDWEEGFLPLSEVEWTRPVLGLEYNWLDRAPELKIERYEWLQVTLLP
jgi:diadenylate cyclase